MGRKRAVYWLNLPLVLLAGTSCSAGGNASEGGPIEKIAPRPAAFAGALGYGAGSKGGHGGKVIAVTTLADAGPGSLRACIDAQSPRICVFRVAGLIRFTTRPPIIHNPFITIAGQTAPGAGITLAHAGGAVGLTPLLIKNTHDVIVRHIRVRLDRTGPDRGSQDAFTIENSRDVILDHVSGSWALDELVGPYGDNDRITISWSIFGEGIPRHDKCALLGSDPKGPQTMTFVGNLCAHNGDRNPDINFPPKSCVEVVNNVFYDAQSQFTEIWETYGGTPVSVIGNNYIKGPSTAEHAVGIDLVEIGSTGPARVYRADNRFKGKFMHLALALENESLNKPDCPLSLQPLGADAAYEAVLASAGAFPRDPFDNRMVSETTNRTGHIVKEPGSIPPIAGATPYPDADGDGMDDVWESAHGIDPKVSDPWADADGDGVANLDNFLDDRHRMLTPQPDIPLRMMRP